MLDSYISAANIFNQIQASAKTAPSLVWASPKSYELVEQQALERLVSS